jgi:hypothetical protein
MVSVVVSRPVMSTVSVVVSRPVVVRTMSSVPVITAVPAPRGIGPGIPAVGWIITEAEGRHDRVGGSVIRAVVAQIAPAIPRRGDAGYD